MAVSDSDVRSSWGFTCCSRFFFHFLYRLVCWFLGRFFWSFGVFFSFFPSLLTSRLSFSFAFLASFPSLLLSHTGSPIVCLFGHVFGLLSFSFVSALFLSSFLSSFCCFFWLLLSLSFSIFLSFLIFFGNWVFSFDCFLCVDSGWVFVFVRLILSLPFLFFCFFCTCGELGVEGCDFGFGGRFGRCVFTGCFLYSYGVRDSLVVVRSKVYTLVRSFGFSR